MSNVRFALTLLIATLPMAGFSSEARAQEPMSAIDWLSRSVSAPVTRVAVPLPEPRNNDRAPQGGPGSDGITVTPLDAPTLDALGILPVSTTGLPRNLWGTTPTETLARLVRAERADTLPAMQSLLYTLLLAELDPPADADGSGALYLARVDKLLDLGALDAALEMLELPETTQPETFRRWFDVALLIGEEDRACETMRQTPEVAPTFPARIFCLARGGDWNAAALSLRTGETLGYIDNDMADLLTHFLDPELSEGAEELPVPARPSPLVLRLLEAIGQPVPTATLPIAFAQSDLRANSGWKSRLNAGERLARTGAIEPDRLLGLYNERQAAASGGIWDRVDAVQDFDRAMKAGDPEAIAEALPAAWAKMVEVELEVPFAELYGEKLSKVSLTGRARAQALRVGLLSDAYESVANAATPVTEQERFLTEIARGRPSGKPAPDTMESAIEAAFSDDTPLDPAFETLLADKRLGEALLTAIDHVTEGARGDLRDLTAGLRLMREVGLEDTARRASLELMLLARKG